MNRKDELAAESEKLINEMESIFMTSGWRNDPDKVKRQSEIDKRLSELFSEANAIK